MRLSGSLVVISAVAAAGAALSACGTPASTAATAVAHAKIANPATSAAASPAAPAADAVSASAEPVATPKAPAATSAPAASAPAAVTTKVSPPGNTGGHAYVPPAARAIDTSHPNHHIGNGTPASCTSAAVVRVVAKGGIITFNCGPNPVTINMTATAKVHNVSHRVVLDGGGKVTLSGMGQRRILYMNTCDKSLTWTTSHCDNQSTPRLTVQNLNFTDGNAQGTGPKDMQGGSGGAIYAEGGQLKVVSSRFTNNRCYAKGPDLGGAAIRAFETWTKSPVYIVQSTFTGGACSNGGALSSIGVSWTVLNSVLSHNRAIGWGQNPVQSGTQGGGSGGAIYTDGDTYTLRVNGTLIRFNHAREGGGAIFYVSDNKTGTLHIDSSTLHDNPSGQFHNFPGTIFYLGHGNPVVTNSHLDG